VQSKGGREIADIAPIRRLTRTRSLGPVEGCEHADARGALSQLRYSLRLTCVGQRCANRLNGPIADSLDPSSGHGT
jgi:hypothetical protein